MSGISKKFRVTILSMIVVALCSCAATQTLLEHSTLEVSTKQSQTIFLDPVVESEKKIYVMIRNTSDQDLEVAPQIKAALRDKGYKIVTDPKNAHYMLQANVLKVGKMSLVATRNALGAGYGSTLAGALVGAGAVGALHGNGNAIIGGSLGGGLISMAADSLVKDVNYTMITDVQISEKVAKGVKVQEEFNSALKNGTSSVTKQVSNKETNYQRYRTRIVSNADKVNLKFKDARFALEQGLVKALAGIF